VSEAAALTCIAGVISDERTDAMMAFDIGYLWEACAGDNAD
jgi:hypothetical protein